MKQSDLAKMLGKRPKDVHQWTLQGVPAKMCFEVARILNVNPEWLITTNRKVARELSAPELSAKWHARLAEATPAQIRAIEAILKS